MFSDIFHTARGGFATHRLMPPGCKPGESDAGKRVSMDLNLLCG